jgi:uncharacterized protein with von Willebrand factor type A (vWA) domain
MSEGVIERLVLFCRCLREHDLAVTPSEVVAATETLRVIDVTDRDEIFLSLRSVLTTSVDEFPIFEELFEAFWNRGSFTVARPLEPKTSLNARPLTSRKKTAGSASFFLEHWGRLAEKNADPLTMQSASDLDATRSKDLNAFSSDQLQQVARLARRIVRRLARNPSRRWKAVRKGARVNMRRSIRLSLKTGGELIELSRKQRKPKRTKLVVICDVSGSMDLYSRFLLQFIYGLQNSFAKVESFVFSTFLSRITSHLKNRTYQRALDQLSSNVQGWSGGTRIGASLCHLNAEWLSRIDKRTIVIILSDGWDTGEPEQLTEALRALKKRAGRLIWLNPLLGTPAYQPLTRGMQAALPFIDIFAPAHDLASLRALEPHLLL